MEKIYLIGFTQALFFVLLILTKKRKVISDYVLSVFILLLGGQLFFLYSFSSGLYNSSPWILIIDIYYWTLLGPALLLYTGLITNEGKKPDWKYLFCLIPTVIVTIGFRKFIFIDGSNFFSGTPPGSWFDSLTSYVWMYNSPFFYLLTILNLRKHKKRIKNYYSYSRNIDLKWLYFLSNGFAVFLFFMLFRPYINRILQIEIPSTYNYTWLVMALYIFGIGFYGYKQKGIFSEKERSAAPPDSGSAQVPFEKSPGNTIPEKEKTLYQKSSLKQNEAERLSKELIDLMENEKLYFDCELNLVSLADKLKTTNHKLSQVINGKFGKNFFDFVNEYRIEEVKRQLFSPEKINYKIISIAYDCGFNSKSTFYTIFKNRTSLTPAEYRRKHLDQAN